MTTNKSTIDQPFRIANTGDVHSAFGVPLFTSEIEQILMTRKSGQGNIGELPWDDTFGGLVVNILHDSSSIDSQRARLRQYIREALSAYPSYMIKSIQVTITEIEGGRKAKATIFYDEDGVSKEYTLNLV